MNRFEKTISVKKNKDSESFVFSNVNAYTSTSAATSSDAQTIIRLAEEKIRVKTIALGLRVTEFFHDFDRLRSGFVTASQFKRYIIELILFCLLKKENMFFLCSYSDVLIQIFVFNYHLTKKNYSFKNMILNMMEQFVIENFVMLLIEVSHLKIEYFRNNSSVNFRISGNNNYTISGKFY
jgi:hypothetical protein